MSLSCGIDVGGTKIAGGVVDLDGNVLEQLRVESPARDVEAIEDAIAGLVAELAANHDDRRRSGSAPQATSTRRVRRSCSRPTSPGATSTSRPSWSPGRPARSWSRTTPTRPPGASSAFGAGHDVDDLLLVTVGTGVGGGLVLDGELYRGAFGVAAEIGHLRVVPGGRLCGCGNYGCFEQYASGYRPGPQRARGRRRPARSWPGRCSTCTGGDVDRIDGPIITDAAREGDTFALEQLAELGRWLGEGIAVAGGRPRPGRGRDRRRRQRGRRAAAGPDPRRLREPTCPGRGHRPMLEIRKADPRQPGRPHRRRRPGPAVASWPLFIGVDVGWHQGARRRRHDDGPAGAHRTPVHARTAGSTSTVVEDALTDAVNDVAGASRSRGRRGRSLRPASSTPAGSG